MIIVDSDVLIEILDKKSKKSDEITKRILESGEELCTTAISVHEVLFGLYKYGKPVREILQLPILDYTKKDAVLSSKLELEAEKSGKPIQRTDAMIAAIAINNRVSLYTLNVKHFNPIRAQGLKIFPE
jgi:predicted nucleic acid-binding protein